MRPIAQTDRHDGPELSLQSVPGIAAMVEKCIDVIEHPVGQTILAHKPPDAASPKLRTEGRILR